MTTLTSEKGELRANEDTCEKEVKSSSRRAEARPGAEGDRTPHTAGQSSCTGCGAGKAGRATGSARAAQRCCWFCILKPGVLSTGGKRAQKPDEWNGKINMRKKPASTLFQGTQ